MGGETECWLPFVSLQNLGFPVSETRSGGPGRAAGCAAGRREIPLGFLPRPARCRGASQQPRCPGLREPASPRWPPPNPWETPRKLCGFSRPPAPPNAGGGARGVFRPRGRGSASLPLATCQHSATSPEGPGLPASLDPPPGSDSFGHMTPLSLARLGLTPPTRLPWGACLSGSGRRSQERAATCRGCRERAPGRWGTAGKRAGGGFCRLNAELIAQCLGRRGTLP